MKRLLILITIVGLTLSLTGATCLQNVQTKVCNPPADVMVVANMAVTLLETALAAFVPGSAAYVALLGPYATATAIQGGVCVSVTQLNNLIAYLQSPPATKMMAKRKAVLNVQALIDWRDKR